MDKYIVLVGVDGCRTRYLNNGYHRVDGPALEWKYGVIVNEYFYLKGLYFPRKEYYKEIGYLSWPNCRLRNIRSCGLISLEGL